MDLIQKCKKCLKGQKKKPNKNYTFELVDKTHFMLENTMNRKKNIKSYAILTLIVNIIVSSPMGRQCPSL